MRKHLLAALLVCGTICAAPPALAASGSASAGGISVTYSVPDTAFDGPECLEVPVTATFSGSGNLSLEASKAGSSNSISAFIYSSADGPAAVRGSLQVCPFVDGAGTYELRGTLTDYDQTAELPSGQTFAVTQAPARITNLRASQRGDVLTVRGKATATSSRGQIGAYGDVTIQGLLPKRLGGKGKWVTVGQGYLNEFGEFTVTGSTSQRLKGARIRAELAAAGWSGSATAATIVR